MTTFLHEYTVRERFREMAAQDRQRTRWGWFRRNEYCSQKIGWRFRIGEALIRLGCRLQHRGRGQPAGTSGEL